MTALSLYLVLIAAPQVETGPMEYEVIAEESVLAIGTHKAGFAAGFAHNHFVVASDYEAHLVFDVADPTRVSFGVVLPVQGLIVDDPVLKSQWYPRLHELGVWGDSFRGMSEDDREEVRTNMLVEEQLYADSFPTIEVRSTTVERIEAVRGDSVFPYRVLLAATIRGVTLHRYAVARYVLEDELLLIEALATFYFTDFGIEPYSKFMGSVKNKNEFTFYVHLRARPE
jgi:hypothetical protein